MKLVCSYCHTELSDFPPFEDDGVSHGMCEPCAEHFRRQWSGLSLNEYLDGFEAPVIILDSDARVVAANQLMADLLSRDQRKLQGLLGGEALECEYSRLPGGCGRTVHCETCAIRNAVNLTIKTRKPLDKQPAFLSQTGGRQALEISTEYVDGAVRVILERPG